MNTDLTKAQKDYAVFLPALSGFYSTYVGKQRFDNYVDPARIPANFPNGVESLNYLNKKDGMFHYKWSLYSAGHANLDVNNFDPKEDMVRNRDRNNSWLLGDSGGYQIGMGVWEADWKDPNCPKASAKRDQVLKWMDAYMDYGMSLDIPAWVLTRSPKGKQNTGITSYQEALSATMYNNEDWIRRRNGNCKFLTVLQGENHADADNWYNIMKKYADPKHYPNEHFNGWSMGGQHTCDLHLALKRTVMLRYDGLLEKGVQDVMHFLGTSRLEWAVAFTDIQRAVRKHHNENFTITFDCASPFLATANGQIYIQTETEDHSKWVYRMQKSVDDKKYAVDSRLFRDAVMQDGIFENFEDSPISKELKVSDICIYKDGVRKLDSELNGEKFDFKNPDHYHVVPDLNKIDKIGRTSWDSFSYAIQMGHNVWSHINAVQEANRKYDAGVVPNMLVQERFDQVFFRDVVNEIFATDDRDKALKLIDEHSRFWTEIPGNASRGKTGKKSINSRSAISNLKVTIDGKLDSEKPEKEEVKIVSNFNKFFGINSEIEPVNPSHDEEFTDDEIKKLEEMEDEQLRGTN